MKKGIIFFIIVLLVLISINYISSLDGVKIYTNKDSYKYGDLLNISLAITNDRDINVNLQLDSKIMNKDNSLVIRPVLKLITVPKNSIKEVELYSSVIDESFKEGTYNIFVELLYQGNFFAMDSRDILIRKTFSNINFSLKSCKDINCNNLTLVFNENNEVFISYKSELQDLNIITKIKYPSGKEKEVAIPYSFIAEEIGMYEVNSIVNKESYYEKSSKLEFEVVDNKKLRSNFLPFNLDSDNNLWLMIIVIVLALIIVLAVYLLRGLRNKL